MQAALTAEDEAQPSGQDFDDTASEASSAVSGMSAYGGSTVTAATSVTGRPASTVGGKKPYKRKQKKVCRHKCTRLYQWLLLRVESFDCLRQTRGAVCVGHGTLTSSAQVQRCPLRLEAVLEDSCLIEAGRMVVAIRSLLHVVAALLD